MKIPFVVCEVRRPLLSLATLEDKGFHMTVKDGCRELGGHGRVICKDKETHILWMWSFEVDR